jgi:hypothetical protein
MKSVFATLMILASLLAFTAGSFAMIHMNDVSHTNCLAAIPGQPNCVGIFDRVKFVITHINALLGASLGMVSSFALVLFAAFIVPSWIGVPDVSNLSATDSNYSRSFIEGSSKSAQRQRRWFSLHEMRDSSSHHAMNACENQLRHAVHGDKTAVPAVFLLQIN